MKHIKLVANTFRESKQTIYAFIGNIVYTFAIWSIAILINHFYGASVLGEYSFIQAVVSPLALFFHLQLKVMATIENKIGDQFYKYLNVYFISEVVFLVVSIIIGVLLNETSLFYSFVIFKIFESFNQLIQGYHQSNNNFYDSFLLSVSKGCIILLIIGLVLYLNYPLYYAFVIICLVWLIVFMFVDIPKLSRDNIQVLKLERFKELKVLFLAGASLSLISSIDVLFVAIPRYFIKGYFGDAELGRFTMVLQFFIASTIFVISVGHPFLVKLKNFYNENDKNSYKKEVDKTLLTFLFFSALIIIGFYLFGGWVMKLIWGGENEYLGDLLALSSIGIIPLFLSSIFVYALNAMKEFSIHLRYYPIILLLAILFSWVLIPNYGIWGAVIAVVLTQTVRMVFAYLAYKYCLKKW